MSFCNAVVAQILTKVSEPVNSSVVEADTICIPAIRTQDLFVQGDRTLYDVNRNILIIEKLREGPRGRLISDHITVPLSSVHEKYRTHLDERGLHRSEQISPRGHSRGKCQIECLEYAIGCHHRHQRPIKED